MKEILLLKMQGLKNKEIAKKLNISQGKVTYWTNADSNIKMKQKSKRFYDSLTNEQKKELQNKRKEYMRNYFKNRYNNDSEFRESIRRNQREYFKRVALNKKSSLGQLVPVSKE